MVASLACDKCVTTTVPLGTFINLKFVLNFTKHISFLMETRKILT